MVVRVIDSGTILDDVEHHFRVFAGPGAGKTYWLTKHVKNVINRSDRLLPSTRIACISYTNVAANQVAENLGKSARYVDTSTIHSFLYRNIVNPYIHLLKDDDGSHLVEYELVEGHDAHIPRYDRVLAWLKSTGTGYGWFYDDDDRKATYEYLKSLVWTLDESRGTWQLKTPKPMARPTYFPSTHLGSYKNFYWKRGIIDHEDVLYFAYQLLDQFPVLRSFLSAKYPYIFIDEFQDTQPVQAKVVEWLAEAGTIVGVIGDEEQAIFSDFTNATPEHFANFELAGHIDYQIKGNRRSTRPIIRLLNEVRCDGLIQKEPEKEGEPVRLFVGELPVILPLVHQYVRNAESLAILTRDNNQAAKARSVSGDAKTELWDEFIDKDRHRERLFRAIAQAAQHGQLNDFSNGIKGIEKAIRLRNRKARNPFTGEVEITKLQRRGLAVSLAELVVNEYGSLRRSKLLKVYNRCRDVISRYVNGLTLKRSTWGKFHNFAKNALFGDLIDSVPLDKDDIRLVRNIHQAKSSEFDSVLVLFDQKRLMHVLEPDKFKSEEERRVTYVGLSRARNKLFIGIPQLSDVAEEKLRKKLTIEVIRAS